MNGEIFLEIGIGTRCRRIFEMLSMEMDTIYKAEGIDIGMREFPILYCLYQKGPLLINDIQKLTGLSHSAVSQTVKKLSNKEYLWLRTADDARSKIVVFSDRGEKLIKRLIPIWHVAKRAMADVIGDCEHNILDAMADYEQALSQKSFTQRYNEKREEKHAGDVEIVPYHVKFRNDWRIINQQWIELLFEMEEEDIINLNDPEKYVLDKGGEIYFTLLDGKPVGAVALKKHSPERYELSKMGVLPEAKGMGLGNMLVEKVLERYEARGGKELFLETNSSLTPAITLYKKYGFKEVPAPENSPYSRADYFMELQKDHH
ncbi:bifunctional helix-turn-helix transcriptional regulator/GNAT family N-acetyltransferase [Pseudemcibacter aquimaris]|uniref:bifunctional helix-turn-helix transcriptional regulator/GNAT family N-acetyltransferase n=1 Tax=Pseudemcibacter aquimaris TaxID=2857064 RepID=UPI0020131BA0|nr:helix-turn-helix domain-containing GNAT family N-acetyltransferase [Pseudemcibacter aquimaris]MCC3859730.1 helix-turn-helix domain-containing GNAT family N-acetyltransferase [Pseudemcibacter aquimaris]WDU60124.1 helix-turn-helix domain-containing GNAT family N-acetyltransferase [Pseudemcibacter aquimaris]